MTLKQRWKKQLCLPLRKSNCARHGDLCSTLGEKKKISNLLAHGSWEKGLGGNYLCSKFMSGCKTDYTTVSANEVRGAGRTDGKRRSLQGVGCRNCM